MSVVNELSRVIRARMLRRTENPPHAQTKTNEIEKPEILRFSDEQKAALEKEGYVIYELTGQSISSLKKAGKRFGPWYRRYDFVDLPSKRSQVAINPNQLFILGSNNQSFENQRDLIKRFSADISAKINGVEAIIGEVPDYLELAFKSPPRQRLFGKKYNYNYTVTETRVDKVRFALVGNFDPDHGITIDNWFPGNSDSHLFVAPLIVPTVHK